VKKGNKLIKIRGVMVKRNIKLKTCESIKVVNLKI
jgi:hypothetical protein